MKKLLIGSLVGALLLFAWQAISWTLAGIHDTSYQYVASQDSILTYLNKELAVEGEYLLPQPNPKLSKKEKEQLREPMMSGSWALINYHPSFQKNMGQTALMGFINSFICVLLVCLVIRKFDVRYKRFFSLFTSVLTFGVVSFLFVWYNQHNWFQATWNMLWGEMIDDFVGWGLAGIWLAWWYGRK